MAKKTNKSKGNKKKGNKVIRDKRVQAAREMAQATIAKMQQEKEPTVKPNPSTKKSDTGTFPTEDNGNSHEKTFVEVAKKSVDMLTRDKIKTTTFHILRNILEGLEEEVAEDEETVVNGKNKANTSLRLSLMIAIPSKDIEDEDAPVEAIQRMNGMIKSLVNKIPSIRLAPWTMKLGGKGKLLSELPEDVDTVEKYAYDYNRFVSPGKNIYCRLHVIFNKQETSKGEIGEVIAGFRKPRTQFMSISHSDALRPKQMGFFAGSVKAMGESPDFYKSFKKFFNLSYLGLWWAFPKSELAWSKNTRTWALHYELDQADVEDGKNDKIISYFSKHSNCVDDNFFGTPMSVAPIFKPMLDDEVKIRVTKHAKKQEIIGNSIKSVTIGGTQILNWADDKLEKTLHRQLMQVESIYDKKVIMKDKEGGNKKDKDKNRFKGRLFYAIIPNQRTKMVTFYYSKANTDEARSVARALPFFIRDHYKLQPSYFSASDAIAECHEGSWDFKKRSFLTLEEKDEKAKFEQLVDTVTAEKETFISESHKLAMAMEGDDIDSVNTRLTKNYEAPAKITETEDISVLTGETRESKAKAYAAAETKKVSLQYVETIDNINGQHQEEMVSIEAKLAAVMLELEQAKKGLNKQINNEVIINDEEMEEDNGLSKGDSNTGEYIDSHAEVGSKGDDDLSGLSSPDESEDDDDEPIITSYEKKKRRDKEKNTNTPSSPSPFRKRRDSKRTFNFDLTDSPLKEIRISYTR